MADYAQHVSTQQTPQSEPIPGTAQVPNSAGGFTWQVDDWTRLQRFLILGNEGGSYYASERKLTQENATAVVACAKADAARTAATIAAVSEGGRAPKNDPAIFALALMAAQGGAIRQHALAVLPRVCRISTHLYHFMAAYEAVRPAGPKDGRNGVGRYSRSVRRALAGYYEGPIDRLALHAVKYQQRDGWSHRDLLRLAHPTAPTNAHRAVYSWIVKGEVEPGRAPDVPLLLEGFLKLKTAGSAKAAAALVRKYDLPREAIEGVDTAWLKEAVLWEALLEKMLPEAMIRNLGVMTNRGLLAPLSAATKTVTERLQDPAALKRARIHPIKVLAALLTYKHGQSRGELTWTPVTAVIDALDEAFYLAFGAVEPAGGRHLLALDVSGSMGMGVVGGVPGLTPRVASAALAMVAVRTEAQVACVAFQTTLTPLDISPKQRLDAVVKKIDDLSFGGTDCSLPMLHAMKKKLTVDTFACYTDNETWAGNIHPAQALRKYREQSGLAAKLIVLGMTANQFSIADPKDAGMLDVCGFDTAVPQVMADFARTR
jgi:60 kDa SS-A/Ro ribonucleoprotein